MLELVIGSLKRNQLRELGVTFELISTQFQAQQYLMFAALVTFVTLALSYYINTQTRLIQFPIERLRAFVQQLDQLQQRGSSSGLWSFDQVERLHLQSTFAEMQSICSAIDDIEDLILIKLVRFSDSNPSSLLLSYARANSIFEKLGDEYGTGICQHNLGNLCFQLQLYASSLLFHRSAISQKLRELRLFALSDLEPRARESLSRYSELTSDQQLFQKKLSSLDQQRRRQLQSLVYRLLDYCRALVNTSRNDSHYRQCARTLLLTLRIHSYLEGSRVAEILIRLLLLRVLYKLHDDAAFQLQVIYKERTGKGRSGPQVRDKGFI